MNVQNQENVKTGHKYSTKLRNYPYKTKLKCPTTNTRGLTPKAQTFHQHIYEKQEYKYLMQIKSN